MTGTTRPARRWLPLAASVVVLAAVAAGVALGSDEGRPTLTVTQPSAAPTPTAPAQAGPSRPLLRCPAATVEVRTPDELRQALATARAGTVIRLADGRYPGPFTAGGTGTATSPIWLCGGRDAVLDGGPPDGDYTLHLDGAAHWRVLGLTVSGGQKGVMVDAGTGVHLQGLLVTGSGDEAIHLRADSTDNEVRGNVVRSTGRRKPKFGEGVYVGTAESNWCDISACRPDRSDRNRIEGNDIAGVTAEGIDVKEGTSGGVIAGNVLSGADASAVDSAIDVKGNGWLVSGNTVLDVPEDGIQVHEITDGSGDDNTFTRNTVRGPLSGYLVRITGDGTRNRVACDNTVPDGAGSVTNVPCTDDTASGSSAPG